MAFFRKIKAGLVKDPIGDHIGEVGNLFFNIETGELRLSDGVTPGGLPVAGSGGTSGVTIQHSSFNQTLGTATTLNFGNNISVALTGTTAAIDVVPVKIAATAPAEPREGDLWFNTGDFTLSIYYTGGWIVMNSGGGTGSQGATGPRGATGFTGATGPAGAAGSAGATGSAGQIGATGVTGSVGATGIAGPAGAAGSIGATGTAGKIGATGATGTAGLQGATGFTGATGVAGTTGNIGATGFTGATGSGTAGATGPQGPAGAAGSINFDGGTPTSSYASGPAFDCGGVT